ncbi:MAG: hypothetical protein AB7O65_12740 [Candidatus Korobacteraceae bacterium]
MKLASLKLLLATAGILFGIPAATQTISPPVAEFRGKVNGMYELRNDSDTPMAVILEIVGFAVNETGVLSYTPLESGVKVDLGAQSFVIPPHRTHMVFYKVGSEMPNTWFAILNTLTDASADRTGIRINFIMPHIVYLYQKRKLDRSDLEVAVERASEEGKYNVRVVNHSDKLSRVKRLELRGFDGSPGIPPFPLFPGRARIQAFEASAASPNARAKLFLEDGFTLEVPLAK